MEEKSSESVFAFLKSFTGIEMLVAILLPIFMAIVSHLLFNDSRVDLLAAILIELIFMILKSTQSILNSFENNNQITTEYNNNLKKIQMDLYDQKRWQDPKIKYKIGEEDVFNFARYTKNCIKNSGLYEAMWCLDVSSKRESEFLMQEEDMSRKGIKRKRLINTNRIKKDILIDHLFHFRWDIALDKYQVFSTNYTDHEIVIFNDVIENKKSKEEKKTIAAIYINRGTIFYLAIYSNDIDFVSAMQNKYNSLLGKKLCIRKEDLENLKSNTINDDKVRQIIDDWIEDTKDDISTLNKVEDHLSKDEDFKSKIKNMIVTYRK